MEINKSTANQICTELNEILKTNVNYISADGFITSSTNKERVGDYHSIAHTAAITNQIQYVYDDSIENVKSGINIPIEFEYEVVGVIGIAGNPNKYATTARLCKALTETLIQELYYNKRENYTSSQMKHIIEMIIFNRTDFLENSLNEFFGGKFNAGYISVISAPAKDLKVIYKLLRKLPNICITEMASIIVIVSKDKDHYFSNLKDQVKNFKIGFGNYKTNIFDLNDSYYEALSSLKVCEKYNIEYCPFSDLKTEKLINSLPNEAKLSLIDQFFANLEPSEMQSNSELYVYYFEANRSLVETAQHFYVHKNTIKYRLEKFSQKTDLNYLNLVESALLYYICRIYFDKDTYHLKYRHENDKV